MRFIPSLAGLAFITSTAIAGQTLNTVQVATGLSSPVAAAAAPGDVARLFIVEQMGRIRILTLGSGNLQPAASAFLNIDALVSPAGGEQGLLGLAFDPQFASNGFFYVNYTRVSDGATVIARYTANTPFATSTSANPSSAVILRTISQPFGNHNGGTIAFGPDGMLYVGMGDGGDANDPGNRAQSDNTLLGKFLRLDVRDSSSTDGDGTYIPNNNPYRGGGDPLDEIWSKGLRNPWKWSFDRANGDLWIADVGQDAAEEINLQRAVQLSNPSDGNSTITNAAQVAGRNYGWRCMEGDECTGLSGCTCNATNLVMPILSVAHAGPGFCAITGGIVYRGNAIPAIRGQYFFSDFCAGVLRSFPANGVTQQYDLTTDWTPQVSGISGIVAFAEDAVGEMYLISLNGNVLKAVPAGGGGCPADLDDGNNTGTPDGGVDINDLLYFLAQFEAGASNVDLDDGSGTGTPDGGVDINDLLFFLSHFEAGC